MFSDEICSQKPFLSALPLYFTHRDITNPGRKAELCLQLEMFFQEMIWYRNIILIPLTADSEPTVCKSEYANCPVQAWPRPHGAP
jgi:hypothetical protein